MSDHRVEWRPHPEHADLHEIVIDGVMVGWLTKRPHYCDRGHWQANVDIGGIDAQDRFPRYYMRFEVAKQELQEFLMWRLFKIDAPVAQR